MFHRILSVTVLLALIISVPAFSRDTTLALYGLNGEGANFTNNAHLMTEAGIRWIRTSYEEGSPTLIEAMTFRYLGHHVNDPGTYVPEDSLNEWKLSDPLDIMRDYLKRSDEPDATLDALENEVESAIRDAVDFAESSPEPDVGTFLADVAEYDC